MSNFREYAIEVKQEDVDNGRRCSCTMCPFALAFKRAFPDHYIHVGVEDVYVAKGAKGFTCTPKDFNFISLLHQYDERNVPIPLGTYNFIGG